MKELIEYLRDKDNEIQDLQNKICDLHEKLDMYSKITEKYTEFRIEVLQIKNIINSENFDYKKLEEIEKLVDKVINDD